MIKCYCDRCGNVISTPKEVLCESCYDQIAKKEKAPWDDRLSLKEELKRTKEELEVYKNLYNSAMDEVERLEEKLTMADRKRDHAEKVTDLTVAKNRCAEDESFKANVAGYILRTQYALDITRDAAWELVKRELEKRMTEEEEDEDDDEDQ